MSHRDEMIMLERLNAIGQRAPSLDEKCQIAELLRASPQMGPQLDRLLIGDRDQLRTALQTAQGAMYEMKALLDKATSPPWHTGVYLCRVGRGNEETGGNETGGDEVGGATRVMVFTDGNRRVVILGEDVNPDSLTLGDDVLLNHETTLVVGKAPDNMPRLGETAVFDRYTADGRLVLRWRDDATIVEAAGPLRSVVLEPGDHVRWDRTAWIAYEKIDRPTGRSYFLDEVPDARPEQVGGQRNVLKNLLAALTTTLVSPDTAKLYNLGGRCSILMIGPPGCGKTLMARVAAAEIARITKRKCKFAVVKPSEWEDPYVGVTQQNIRNCFRSLREAARDGLAILFLDEIEGIGRIRGSAVGHHSDKFLGAFLAEMDGFSGRDGIAVIAATNRKDLMDPSLLERISDLELVVPRPNARGAREIFEVHLPQSLPFSPNGDVAAATRSELAQRAVSRLYSPNAGNEVCVIKFRDGKTRTVAAHELMSGRTIEQICRAARQSAFLRDVSSQDRGLRVEDIDGAVTDAIQRLSTLLTPRNAHAYLGDLPQDIDVVAVEPVVRRVANANRYLNVT